MSWFWIWILDISTIIRLACSVTSFCWGIYMVNVCFLIPWSFKEQLNALETNSPPLSERNTLNLFFDCVFTSALKSLNFSKHSPSDFNAFNHFFLRNHERWLWNILHRPWMWSKLFLPPNADPYNPWIPVPQSPSVFSTAPQSTLFGSRDFLSTPVMGPSTLLRCVQIAAACSLSLRFVPSLLCDVVGLVVPRTEVHMQSGLQPLKFAPRAPTFYSVINPTT